MRKDIAQNTVVLGIMEMVIQIHILSLVNGVELPEELPDGFVYEERGNVIRKNYVDNLHPNQKYIEILNTTKDLIEWADNLPDEEY